MSEKQQAGIHPERDQSDDIHALSDAFSLTAFRYIDISRQERLAAINARWPLLAELGAMQRKEK